MMETGWIFPDGTEYPCGGDYLKIHEVVPKYFINGLPNSAIKEQIEEEIDELFFKCRDPYSRFAIEKLGWIKVGTSIRRVITYAGYDFQSELVAPYEECGGYYLDDMYYSSDQYLPMDMDGRSIVQAINEGYNKQWR